jgi:cell division transport system permease protein
VSVRILLGEAWRGLRAEPSAAMLSVIVMGLALYIPGMLYLTARTGDRYSQQIRAQVKLRAYLHEVAAEPFDSLIRAIQAQPGVRAARFKDRQELLDELESELGPGLLTGLPDNPLPRAIDIRVAPEMAHAAALDSLAVAVQHLPEVEEVVYGRAWAHRADQFFAEVQWFLGLLTLLLALLVLAIAANIVRLIVRTRRVAIGVWLLLGASPLYARLPYYIEGTLMGMGAACVALGLLYPTSIWLSAYLPAFGFLTLSEGLLLGAIALGVALLGAVWAARRQIVPL